MIFKKLSAFILAAVTALCLTACGGGGGETAEEDGVRYETVDHVNFPISPIRTLNPVVSSDEDTYHIARLVYDGLFRMDSSMTPQADLAKDYEVSGSEMTVDLINTRFHDGKRLTARDVEFTIDAMKYAGKKCPYYSQISNIRSADAVDGDTVIISFYSENSIGPDYLTFPILPAHRYDSIYSLRSDDQGIFRMVGTGRYKYRSYSEDRSLELVANEDYHGEKAENSVSFMVVTNKEASYRLVNASSLTAMVTKSSGREANAGQSGQKIKNFPGNEMLFIGFNFQRDLTYDKNIRKAVAAAIDNETIIQEVFMNSGMTNDSIYYPGYLGTKKGKDPYACDVNKSRRYLARAGYSDPDDDGYVETEAGSRLTLSILADADRETSVSAADMIEGDLEEAGIHADVRALPRKAYLSSLKKGSFDIYIGILKYDELMDYRVILEGEENPVRKSGKGADETAGDHGGLVHSEEETDTGGKSRETKTQLSKKMDNSNFVRYYSSEVNDLLDGIKSGKSPEETKKEFLELKKILNDDLPYYCLMQMTYGAVQSPSISGEMEPLFDDFYNGIGDLKARYEVSPDETDQKDGKDGKSAGSE